MARSRNIKPSFFINEKLAELSFSTRLLFIGLWTMCDRLGRMEDRPKRIKMTLFPADRVDVERGLVELAKAGFITRYVVDGERFIEVPNFTKHQTPHVKEAASTIPAPDKHGASTRQAPVECPLIPDSLQSDSLNVCVGGDLKRDAHLEAVLTGLRKRYNLNVLRDEPGWVDAADWSLVNNFSSDQFLECFDLLSKQKWRKGRITPKNVADNLPELEKVKEEVKGQDGSDKQRNPAGKTKTDEGGYAIGLTKVHFVQ